MVRLHTCLRKRHHSGVITGPHIGTVSGEWTGLQPPPATCWAKCPCGHPASSLLIPLYLQTCEPGIYWCGYAHFRWLRVVSNTSQKRGRMQCHSFGERWSENQDNLNLLALKYIISMLQSQTGINKKACNLNKEFLELWSGSLAGKAEIFTYLENWIR